MSQVKETSKKFDALAKLDENEFMQANPSVVLNVNVIQSLFAFYTIEYRVFLSKLPMSQC